MDTLLRGMLHHLPTPSAARLSGAQQFSAADNETIDACAQLMVRASRKQRHRWTRQAAAQHIAALLSVEGTQAYVCRDNHSLPLCFVIGHAAEQIFHVCELCADESLRHEGIGMSLLDHVRKTVQASEVVFDAARSRRHAREFVRSL